ncbi:MAG TPA: hypothetical protein VFV38_21655 [Ktedonobacteraceae bacterium]|nr:hypothetical protein [Ktedonobacteraceae bacterium]
MMSEEPLLGEMKSQESIFIFCRKSTQVILTVGATVFLMMCGKSFLGTVFSVKNWWDIVFLVLWLLSTIGCALLVFIFLMFRFKPVLIINREGIEDHSHLGISFGTICVKWQKSRVFLPQTTDRPLGFR